MTKQFKGKIAHDVRDSVPDWDPYLPPQAPEGAPNVLFLAWDDVGYATMDIYGGPVETPNMRRIADRGVIYGNFHTPGHPRGGLPPLGGSGRPRHLVHRRRPGHQP